MRSRSTPGGRCDRCHLRPDLCLCADIRPIRTRTRIVIVRHQLEAKRSSGTARIALLALPDAVLVEYGRSPLEPALTPLLGPSPALLYPDGAAPCEQPPDTIVVVDGSWSQARHMMVRSPVLRRLPRLVLPPSDPLPRLRVAPHPGGLSTLEALVRAIGVVEGPDAAAPLEELCRLHVTRGMAAKGLPVDGALDPEGLADADAPIVAPRSGVY